MSEQMIWELIGYLGSALVLVSLLMTSIVKLRIINAVGCFIFCLYAFKINSIPTAVMNVALVGIDIFFLIKLSRSHTAFTIVKTTADDSTVKYITGVFGEDMKKYFDTCDVSKADEVYITFEKETVAGVSAGIRQGETFELLLDYTTPQYRDCKVGHELYGFLKEQYSALVYSGSNPLHIPYLIKMGYEKKDGKYVLALDN